MHKLIDMLQVSHIEVAECKTEADMFLYEIYYINRYKPMLNRDDKSKEDLTINLPELDFQILHNESLMNKWREKISRRNEFAKNYQSGDCLVWD